MEKFSNQNLKQVKDILKDGNLSITKHSALSYDKLNIVTGSNEYRTKFLYAIQDNACYSVCYSNFYEKSLGVINNDNFKNVASIAKGKKRVVLHEKDIENQIRDICDDIFAISRLNGTWNELKDILYIINIPDNDYNTRKYIEKLNKVIPVAGSLNIIIILGMLSCPELDYANMLNIANNQLGDSYVNGDRFKVNRIGFKNPYELWVEDSEEELISFETYGYHKVVDDEYKVVYQNDNYSITVDKKVYRYIKENRFTQSSSYILEHEDRLIHRELDKFAKYRITDKDRKDIQDLIDKKKIRLTQETIDKTNKILDTIGEENIDKNKTYRIYVKKDTIGIDNKKCGENTVYVSELTPDKEILFNEQNNIPSKQRAFDWKTTIFIMNELIGKFNVVGKEEIK